MPVTLNISNLNIKLVASRGKDIVKWETEQLPPGLVKDGNIVDMQAVAAKIDSLFSRLNIPRTRVLITLAGISFTYRLLTLPNIKPSLLKEAVTRAAQKEIPLPLESLYVDWQIIRDNGKEIQVFLAGVPRNLVDSILRTATLAKISLAALDIKPLAVARAAGQTDAIIVDFEPDCFNIVIVADGLPVILHTVIPKSEAAGLEDNVSQMLDELNRTVSFYNLTHTENPIPAGAPLIISGEYAGEDATFQLLRSHSEHEVQPLTVQFHYPSGFSPSVYAGNTGLLLKNIPGGGVVRLFKISGSDVDLNFIAARHRSMSPPVSIRDFLLPPVIVLGLALIIFLSIVRTQAASQTVNLQTDLDIVNRNLRLVRAAVDEAAAIEKQITELTGKIQTLEKEGEALSGKARLSGILDFVAANLPSGAFLNSIDVTPREIALDGRTETRTDIFNYTSLLEKQGGYSGVRIASINEKSGAAARNLQEGFAFQIVIMR